MDLSSDSNVVSKRAKVEKKSLPVALGTSKKVSQDLSRESSHAASPSAAELSNMTLEQRVNEVFNSDSSDAGALVRKMFAIMNEINHDMNKKQQLIRAVVSQDDMSIFAG